MDEIEAAGEAITGAALARAVEPDAGEDGHAHETDCLNCGTPLAGPHCHQCGQAAHVHRTIAGWWHDLAHGVLHLDGKVWRTLPLLVWRPGELTRRYIEGERAKFVSPLAFFLFSVFLMFAMFSTAGASLTGDPTGFRTEVAREISQTEGSVAAIERDRAAAEAAGTPTADIDRRLASEREDLASLRRLEEDGIGTAGGVDMTGPKLLGLDAAFRKAMENPALLIYKLQTNAYKFSWALIPLSVPFLWLLFLHRRRYREQFSGYDHFVFITYSIAAMSLALIALVLLGLAGISSGPLRFAFMLIPPVHIFRQLRGAYRLSRWSAAWRTAALLFFAMLVLSLFGLMLLAMGLFG